MNPSFSEAPMWCQGNKGSLRFPKISNIPYLLKHLGIYYNYMYVIFKILKGYYRD